MIRLGEPFHCDNEIIDHIRRAARTRNEKKKFKKIFDGRYSLPPCLPLLLAGPATCACELPTGEVLYLYNMFPCIAARSARIRFY